MSVIPSVVIEHILDSLERVDTDQDGYISYIEFMCVLSSMKCFSQMQNVSEQDIEESKPLSDTLNDIISLTVQDAAEWVSRIYLRKDSEINDFDVALQQAELEEIVHDWDVGTTVSHLDLDEIVEEVFGGMEDGTDFSDETGSQSEAPRKRKRDMVKNALKQIVNHERGSTRRKIKSKLVKMLKDYDKLKV
jgi:hypothetical protein